jgi:hypothetical protein
MGHAPSPDLYFLVTTKLLPKQTTATEAKARPTPMFDIFNRLCQVRFSRAEASGCSQPMNEAALLHSAEGTHCAVTPGTSSIRCC